MAKVKECFTMRLINKEDIFKVNSEYKNDELIIFNLVGHNILEYKCYGGDKKSCPTKNGNWRRKKLYLILQRKNKNVSDLTPDNLSLICPNCYCQENGNIAFINNVKSEMEVKCKYCSYLIKAKYKSDTCLSCQRKMQKIMERDRIDECFARTHELYDTTSNVSTTYKEEYNNLSISIKDNLTDTKPRISSSLKGNSNTRTRRSKTSNSINIDDLPIINLNTNINCDDLLADI